MEWRRPSGKIRTRPNWTFWIFTLARHTERRRFYMGSFREMHQEKIKHCRRGEKKNYDKPNEKYKAKKLSHKQVEYWAYLCVWKCIFLMLAVQPSLRMIWYGHFCVHIFSMFRLNDQAHKFLKTLNCIFPFVHHTHKHMSILFSSLFRFVFVDAQLKLNCLTAEGHI